jgi:hypothetical protein
VTLSRRQIRLLFAIGLVIGVAAMPAVAVLTPLLDGGYDTSGAVPYVANSGAQVNLQGSTSVQNGTAFPADDTIELNTTSGNVTVIGSGDANVTIHESNITGDWTKVSNLDVASNGLYIGPEDKPAINVSGGTDRVEWRGDMAVDDGQTDFVYAGASGETTLTIRGLSADTTIGAIDADTSTMLDANTTDANGIVTLTMPNSEHTVELKTSDGGPVLDETTASPTGDLSNDPSELSINVSDPDFPEDNVTVEFYLNGSLLETKTVSSAGEVSASIGTIDSRQHTWNATAEDEYGNADETSDFTFTTPGTLEIYHETEPEDLVNNTQVNLTIFADDEIHTRNTTDGTVDLSGLPTEDLVIRGEADGFFTRELVLESLADQPRMYMLNTSASTVNVTFQLEDKTGGKFPPVLSSSWNVTLTGGNFPPETTQLYIEKPITRNGSTSYEVVAADEFGSANSYRVPLEKDQRYRLRVKNRDNDQRTLGPYAASETETVTLTVGSLSFDASDSDTYLWSANYTDAGGSPRVRFNFTDPQDDTTDLNVVIYERGNKFNEIYNNTFAGPVGNVSASQLLTANQSDLTWVVEFEGDRGGETIEGSRVVGANTGPGVPLDTDWKNRIAIGFLIIMGGSLGAGMRVPEAAGIVISLLAGIFWQIGWLPTEVGAGAIVAGLVLSGLMLLSKSRGAAT